MQPKIIASAIGEAVVDVNLDVSLHDLKKLNLSKDDSLYIDKKQKLLFDEFTLPKNPIIAPGGSVANSVHALSSLYGNGAFIGNIGRDMLGEFFFNDLKRNNVLTSDSIFKDNIETSVCYVFVTDDAQRTFVVFRDDASCISLDQYDKDFISSSNFLLLEMYLVRNNKVCNEISFSPSNVWDQKKRNTMTHG